MLLFETNDEVFVFDGVEEKNFLKTFPLEKYKKTRTVLVLGGKKKIVDKYIFIESKKK
jgi:hypothetical protein